MKQTTAELKKAFKAAEARATYLMISHGPPADQATARAAMNRAAKVLAAQKRRDLLHQRSAEHMAKKARAADASQQVIDLPTGAGIGADPVIKPLPGGAIIPPVQVVAPPVDPMLPPPVEAPDYVPPPRIVNYADHIPPVSSTVAVAAENDEQGGTWPTLLSLLMLLISLSQGRTAASPGLRGPVSPITRSWSSGGLYRGYTII